MLKQFASLALVAATALTGFTQDSDNPFIGRWAFTTPGGGAGWLGVNDDKGFLDAEILWGGGSVVPVAGAMMIEDGRLFLTRSNYVHHRNEKGEVIRTHEFQHAIFLEQVEDDMIEATMYSPNYGNKKINEYSFDANRIPELPESPDLDEIEYGDPITLFNGENLDGWKLTNENQVNGWFVEDGVLVNNPEQKRGEPHISYGNLRTVDTFEDFKLTCEVKVPKDGNSGIYLRGIYEVQVLDSYGRPLDNHHMGAIYSRITPETNAEKPAGQWQSYEIILCDRHVTVTLNGTTIIDNEPLMGVTGGALTSNEFEPGPIYLQGDHTGVSYRDIVLTPIIKD